MRIAVVSDIHGNLVALDAVLADLEQQSVDEVWCGGDVAFGGPWPSECVARVRAARWDTVRGNTDVWVTGDPQTVDSPAGRDEIEAFATEAALSEDDRRWLLGLPLGHSGRGSLLLVHGTPQSPFTAPEPDAPSSEFASYEGGAAVVVYGHVHRAFVRRLADGTIVCNSGSVGAPRDGRDACYLLVDQQGPDWTLRHRRVPYDRAAVLAAGRDAGGAIGAWTEANVAPA